MPADYYLYNGGTRTEILNNIYTPRPQHDYSYYTQQPTLPRTVCQIQDQSDVHWYNGTTKLAGTYPFAPTTEFTETTQGSPHTSVKGIRGLLDFYGQSAGPSPSGSYFVETLYFTTRYCSDAGVEYGFVKNIADGTLEFYWSRYTNCLSDGRCRQTDNPYGPIQNQRDGSVYISNLQLNSQSDLRYYWQAYLYPDSNAPHGYSFRFGAADPWTGQYGRCSLNGGPLGDCTWSITPDAWFPADQIDTGWIVVGTQTGGSPNLASSPTPVLSAINVSIGQ